VVAPVFSSPENPNNLSFDRGDFADTIACFARGDCTLIARRPSGNSARVLNRFRRMNPRLNSALRLSSPLARGAFADSV